ncbi:aminotransferase class V-fold PLP-dependent enzyme [Candidatus Woesearchaeota archaeon]|nr:aminotransferase class V-fold PLP-dependent enzyme [Candidatus Woesearchaeota archaeon]
MPQKSTFFYPKVFSGLVINKLNKTDKNKVNKPEVTKTHKKLFIPGPVEVRAELLKELSRPMIGHRSKEFMDLFKDTSEKLKKLFYTDSLVFISTSSGSGLWEAAIRNCVEKKCLCCVNGAFSNKWYEVAAACEKNADKIDVEWGKAIKPGQVDEKLKTGEYDAVTLVHNETSTGVENPLYEIADVIKKYPKVMFLVDAVSSFAGVKIEVDKLGIDVCLASVQKALGLPPGLSVCSVSEKAMNKSKLMKNKGYYFDFEVFLKYYNKNQTPTTPSIPHIYALDTQLNDILNEGLDSRFARHKELAGFVRKWAMDNGFELFAEPGYESKTVTCVKNTKGISVAELNNKLGEKGFMISNGYGALKEKTFRIAHMADFKKGDLKELFGVIKEMI